jgi:hypothetical protein
MRRATFLFLLVLLAAACAGRWRDAGTRAHPALTDGAVLATNERGRGTSLERRVSVVSDGVKVESGAVDDVLPYVRPLDTPEAAIAYSELAREIPLVDSGAIGAMLRFDGSIDGPGGNGKFSRADAAFWGVSTTPTARPYGGGFEVTRVVLLTAVPNPDMPRFGQPWRVVLLREVVFPDGRIRRVDHKTLTNGEDAARFATF